MRVAKAQYFFHIGTSLTNIDVTVESFLIHCNGRHAQPCQNKMALAQRQKLMRNVFFFC